VLDQHLNGERRARRAAAFETVNGSGAWGTVLSAQAGTVVVLVDGRDHGPVPIVPTDLVPDEGDAIFLALDARGEPAYALSPAAMVSDQGPDPDPGRVGEIIMYGVASAPSAKWIACDGGEYAVATYPALDTLLGTTYGARTNGASGAGSTHFRVPDLRSRAPVGTGTGSGLTARAAGDRFGTETHTLTTGQLPDHSHQEVAGWGSGADFLPQLAPNLAYFGTGGTINATMKNPNGSSISGGAGQSHPNVQPSIALPFYIRAKP